MDATAPPSHPPLRAPQATDDDGGGQPLSPGAHPLDLSGVVPADAGGLAVEIWAVTESQPTYLAVAPCAGPPPMLPQVTTGTIGYGDINVAHVPYTPGTPMCVHLGAAGVPAYVNVTLLGYFTDTLEEGGDEPPSYESQSALRPGLVPREPSRVLDTRQGIGATAGKVAAGGTLALDLGSVVTPNTSAVTLNVTATAADADGYVTVFRAPTGCPTPPT